MTVHRSAVSSRLDCPAPTLTIKESPRTCPAPRHPARPLPRTRQPLAFIDPCDPALQAGSCRALTVMCWRMSRGRGVDGDSRRSHLRSASASGRLLRRAVTIRCSQPQYVTRAAIPGGCLACGGPGPVILLQMSSAGWISSQQSLPRLRLRRRSLRLRVLLRFAQATHCYPR